MEKHLLQPKPLPRIQEGLSKRQIAQLAAQTVDAVLETQHALQVAEGIAAMEAFAKEVRRDERFVDCLRDELQRHNGAAQTPSGARLELCEAAVQYDYATDPSWRELTQQIAALTEQRKALEAKLRSIAPGKMWVDHETGEVLDGPLKVSKSTYRITLSK